MKNKIFLRIGVVCSLFLALLVLSGCTGSTFGIGGNTHPTVQDTENQHYYQGSDGIDMRFISGSPPPRVYYYSTDPSNTFEVSVETHNEGASNAIGALFIDGYSAHIVSVEGIERKSQPLNGCGISLRGLGGANPFGGFSIGCLGQDGGMGGLFLSDNAFDLQLRNVGQYLGIPLDDYTSVGGVRTNDKWDIDFDFAFDNPAANYALFNHGNGLIMSLSSYNLNSYYGFPFNDGMGVLKGDNYWFPGGDFDYQSWTVDIDDWPAGLDQARLDFQVTSCYGYTTYASPTICLDPAPFEDRNKICTPQEYSWSGSQGAPVAITSLKQDPTPKGTALTFTVRNVGGGDVFHPGYLHQCSPYYPGILEASSKDVVLLGDIRIGNQRLDCEPNIEVRLREGVGTFTCNYRYSGDFSVSKSAMTSPVFIELWYGYQETIQTSTLVKRAG